MQLVQNGSGFVGGTRCRALTAGALAFCCAVALVLIDLAINRRSASERITDWKYVVIQHAMGQRHSSACALHRP
jgi:hypothetical protein